jgi:hypothetical protein
MHPAFSLAWPDAPVPPPPPSRSGERWVDASNYTGVLTDRDCLELRDAGITGVIIQAITGLDGISYTRQQLNACVQNGLDIAGYVWCFPGSNVASRLKMFDGFELAFLALDVEQAGLTRADVDRDLGLCDSYQWDTTWVYTGKWFFDQQGWSQHTWWSDRPLWNSLYDRTPVANDHFVPYHGWTSSVLEQWIGTSQIGHVGGIDQNVFA